MNAKSITARTRYNDLAQALRTGTPTAIFAAMAANSDTAGYAGSSYNSIFTGTV